MDEVIREFHNGDLHRFAEVIINSGNGYTTKLQVDAIEKIELYKSGTIYVEEVSGNIRYYGKADILFKQSNI